MSFLTGSRLQAKVLLCVGHPKGSIFVTTSAEEYLDSMLKIFRILVLCSPFISELLQDSPFHRDLFEMKRYFDKTTKCAFRDPNDPHFIRFGSVRDKDVKLKIVAGKLRLDGYVIGSLSFLENSNFDIGKMLLLSSSLLSNVSLMGF